MSDPTKQALLEELVRHTLLGEEHATIQFHLFSVRSASSSHVVKPRVLCANNPLLTQSSKYFLDREWFFIKKKIVSFIDGIQC